MADEEKFLGNYILAKETGWGRGIGAAWGRFERSIADTPTITKTVIPSVELPQTHLHIPQGGIPSAANLGQGLMILGGFILLCLAALVGYWLIESFTVWPSWIKYACIGIACLAAVPPVLIGLAFVFEIIGEIIEAITGLIQLLLGLTIIAGVGYLAFSIAF